MVTGISFLGAALLGLATNAVVASKLNKKTYKPSIVEKWKQRKKRMYLEGQNIYHRYKRTRNEIRNAATVSETIKPDKS